MARTKGFIAGLLGKLGTAFFSLFSRFEERGILPKTSRWLKYFVFGLLVAAVGALSAEAETIMTCYIAVRIPEVKISDVSVTPNPTQGADSVRVRAIAKVLDPTIKDNFVKDAWLSRQRDTLKIPMKALDGKFGDTLEILEATFYVGDLDTGSHWFFIDVTTSQGNEEVLWRSYNITILGSLEKDSVSTKEN